MKTKKILIFFILLFTIISSNAQIKVNSSGKTVIGPTTTWADYILNITGSGTSGCDGKIGFGDNSTSTLNVIVGEYGTTDSDQLLLHGDNGIHFSTTESLSTKMFLDENGNFGIGITPTEKLHINGSVRGSQSHGSLRINTEYRYVDIGCNYYMGHHTHFITNAVYGYYFDKGIEVVGGRFSSFTGDLTLATQRNNHVWVKPTTGYVGIGDATPSYKLDVYGDIATYGILRISSDERLKKDIVDLDEQKINNLYNLQAKTYIKDNSLLETENEIISTFNDTSAAEDFSKIEIDTTPKIGFIAQQLKEYFPDLVSQDNKGFYNIDYISLIPVIVEAIKKQQKTIDSLAYDISIIKSDNSSKLKSAILTSDEYLNELTDIPILYQNVPNPFNKDTEIRFYLPERINNVKLYIYNMQGNQLRSINITQRGYGSEVIHGSELQPGIYLYALIVNGLEVDTKRMILTD